jgi:hypothetical protein
MLVGDFNNGYPYHFVISLRPEQLLYYNYSTTHLKIRFFDKSDKLDIVFLKQIFGMVLSI